MKALLGLGIIVLFAGVIIFSMSNQYTETFENQLVKRVEDLSYGKWKISAQFNKNEKLFVAFTGPNLENIPDGSQAIATLWVNISDPKGDNTTFQVQFRRNIITKAPELNVSLESNDGGLAVDLKKGTLGSPEQIGGVTQFGGNYTAYVYTYGKRMAEYYYPPDATLSHLEFFEIVANRTYPFRTALPVGLVLIAGGAFFSIWAARSPRRHPKLRSKHKL